MPYKDVDKARIQSKLRMRKMRAKRKLEQINKAIPDRNPLSSDFLEKQILELKKIG